MVEMTVLELFQCETDAAINPTEATIQIKEAEMEAGRCLNDDPIH